MSKVADQISKKKKKKVKPVFCFSCICAPLTHICRCGGQEPPKNGTSPPVEKEKNYYLGIEKIS